MFDPICNGFNWFKGALVTRKEVIEVWRPLILSVDDCEVNQDSVCFQADKACFETSRPISHTSASSYVIV